MNAGSLLQRVQPEYPPMAKIGHIQGEVVLSAIISKEGTIENLRVLSGHPMLVRAAIDAVHRWRYRPYVLNNAPIEVETQITVNFSLRWLDSRNKSFIQGRSGKGLDQAGVAPA
jgi:periplasmic protein TonB